MDISSTLAPKSDQMDYEDLISGPKTLTITGVRKGPSAEQPIQIDFEEFDRPWRPAKTVRRVLVACWGPDASVYIGRRVTLYGDPTVLWAGQPVGGIRLSHVSDITEPVTVALTVRRGQRAPTTVNPLRESRPAAEPVKDTSGRDWLTELASTNGGAQAIWDLATEAKKAGANPQIRAVMGQAYEDAKGATS
ncbi:hypothetical protein IT072_02560 [Leifsonia sp. ZF2019]|uniref:hypothetical protein n=1 Tax=Leifsonia sp. ZF2019 TaxID=2781978 RepID=UPI001CBAB56B|nr:hypothetical protein [Leifsonia sp. ZF2019]UAJ79979.1 hypothetical protein IT072_02560 [Leifsonia sp. ZF2019]